MTFKKLPSLLTDQEILDLINGESDAPDDIVEMFDQNDDVISFLQNYNIAPGETKVTKKLVYKLYKLYSEEPLTQKQFTTRMNHYISDTGRHFLISIDQFALSTVIYESQKKRDKTKSLTYQKHFEWFLTESNFKKGKTWLEGFILFEFYKQFCKSRRVTPRFGYVNFHKFLKLHFDHKRIKENRALWFKVSENIIKSISEEDKEIIRKSRQKT